MRRVIPAVGLFFLAPLVGEFLLGDIPVTELASVILLAPMYGGAALLIREVCRRRGWGWPGIVLLAAAYGVLEEGIVTQSLFDPAYAGKHLLSYGHLPALGMGASWTVFVITLHTVWSISVPIAVVELLTRSRRTTVWLGRVGLGVTAALAVIGMVAMTALTYRQYEFVAAPGQLAGAAIAVLALVVVAALVGRRSVPGTAGSVPAPWLLGVASLLVTSAVTGAWYLGKDSMPWWLFVAAVIAGYVVSVRLVGPLSRRTGWRPAHQLGLVAGALLTYAWEGFVTSHMQVETTPEVRMASHVIFALGAVVLILVTAVRLRVPAGHAAARTTGEMPAGTSA